MTDTLLDLHAKLSTVVRYYDRMLEERLSKAYSQQNLGGYNLPPPRQPSGPYPSIHSYMPSNPAVAENFYSGQQQVNYQTPSQPHLYQQTPQAKPQPQFASYGVPPEVHPGQYPPSQQLQRTESWQNRAPSEPQDTNLQPQTPQQSNTALPSDPNTPYYYTPQQHSQPPTGPSAPGPAPDASQSPYPNLQQSIQYSGSVSTPSQPVPVQSSQPSQPTQLPQQPAQTPQQPQQTLQSPSQPQPSQPTQQASPLQQQAYWQPSMPQQQHQPPAAPQGWAYGGYGQESLPSVPQNEPVKQPVKEEALIEF